MTNVIDAARGLPGWPHLERLARRARDAWAEADALDDVENDTPEGDVAATLQATAATLRHEADLAALALARQVLPHADDADTRTVALRLVEAATVTVSARVSSSVVERVVACACPACGAQLPVVAARAHLPYVCRICHAKLQVGLSATGSFVLRVNPYTQRERLEHNAIVHALLTAPARGGGQRAVTGPDVNSGDMEQSYFAMVAALQEVHRYVLTGRGASSEALAAAERAQACRLSYRLAERRYKSQRREVVQTGRWRDNERFVVEIDEVKYAFEFLAVWTDANDLEVVNGDAIERATGMTVGPEGWRQLVRMLQRIEAGKPGQAADTRHVVWRENANGSLTLRPHVRTHYPLAVAALEALRRSLDLDDSAPRDAAPDDTHPVTSVAQHNEDLLVLQRGIKPTTGSVRSRVKAD